MYISDIRKKNGGLFGRTAEEKDTARMPEEMMAAGPTNSAAGPETSEAPVSAWAAALSKAREEMRLTQAEAGPETIDTAEVVTTDAFDALASEFTGKPESLDAEIKTETAEKKQTGLPAEDEYYTPRPQIKYSSSGSYIYIEPEVEPVRPVTADIEADKDVLSSASEPETIVPDEDVLSADTAAAAQPTADRTYRPSTYYETRHDETNEYYYTEVTNTEKKTSLRIARNYLIVAVICAAIGLIYEIFSHSVFSVFMVFAFVIPLFLGALPNLVIGLSGQKTPGVAAENLYACGIATLTIGSMLRGALDIFGTTNSLLKYYWIVGAAFVVTGAIVYFAQKRREPAQA